MSSAKELLLPSMTPIHCKRPPHLLPKAIGESHVFNFFGRAGLLAVISGRGQVFVAHETVNGIALCTQGGETMEKGPVYRFIEQHLHALKDGAIPVSLTSGAALLRPSPSPTPTPFQNSSGVSAVIAIKNHRLGPRQNIFTSTGPPPHPLTIRIPLPRHITHPQIPPVHCTPPPASVAQPATADYI